MLLVQQKQDEYIKQLASKIDVVTTHNKMLETQIAQQGTSLSTPPGRLPSKPEVNLREQCNCVTLKSGIEESMGMELEKGEEVRRAENEVKDVEFETLPFGGVRNVVVPEEFLPKPKDPGSFPVPCMVGQVRIDRALCDLGISISLMPYSIFQKLGLDKLQPTPISLQFTYGSMKRTDYSRENILGHF